MAQQNKRNFKYSLLAASVVAVLSAPASLMAAEQEGAAPLDEPEVIMVRGIRGSMVKSMVDKRTADQVVDTINATDIGKLPDATIADSLSRVTGISISRSGGEGSSISLRGTGSVNTTINGEQMLAAGSITTLQPNFNDIPSTMVNGLDVIKSMQAKNLSGGSAGIINLKTIRPLDLDEGVTALGKVEVADGSMGEDKDKKFSGFFGYNLNATTGISVNISTDKTYLADFLTGQNGNQWGNLVGEATHFAADDFDVNGNEYGWAEGTAEQPQEFYIAPQGYQSAHRFVERERNAANFAFQHYFTDALKLTGDVFYTDMEEYQYSTAFQATQAWTGRTGWFTVDDFTSHTMHRTNPDDDGNLVVTPFENQVLNSFGSGELQARRINAQSQTQAFDREALNTNLQLEWDVTDSLSASVRWIHGEAKEDLADSVTDTYVNTGIEADRSTKAIGGEPNGLVNPWGYTSQLETLRDGTVIEGSDQQIPVGLTITDDNFAWNLPYYDQDGNLLGVLDAGDVPEGATKLGSDPSKYALASSNLRGYYSDATLDAFRLDAKYEFDLDHLVSFEGGVRFGKREVNREGWFGLLPRTNAYGDPFLARWKDPNTNAPVTLESYVDPIRLTYEEELEGGLIETKLQSFATKITNFEGATGIDAVYAVDPKAMKDPVQFHSDMYDESVVIYKVNTGDYASYNLEEERTSLYAQSNFAGDLFWDLAYTATVGLRYVKTEYSIDQLSDGSAGTWELNGLDYIVTSAGAVSPPGEAVNTKRDYDDWLPSVNLNLEVTDDMQLRFAYNKTTSIHNAQTLAGGLTVNRSETCGVFTPAGEQVSCATAASQTGNPMLDPLRTENFDLSWEWYFSDTGIFSLGVFYMDGKNSVIQGVTYRSDIKDSDGEVRGYNPNEVPAFTGLVRTTTPVNGPGGSTKGFEVGYQQAFDFLPGFLDGLGVTANYTYAPSESGIFDYEGKELPAEDNSEHTANFALWYEKDGLQARLASNYRSEQYLGRWTLNDQYLAEWQKPTLYIDASVSYDITDDITVMFQGTNLTEEVQTRYYQWEDLPSARNYNERKVALALQVRL